MEDDGGAGVLLGPVRGEPGGGGADTEVTDTAAIETSSCIQLCQLSADGIAKKRLVGIGTDREFYIKQSAQISIIHNYRNSKSETRWIQNSY